MTNIPKRCLSLLTAAGLCLCLLPGGTAFAEPAKTEIDHIASYDAFFSGQMIAVDDEEEYENVQYMMTDSISYLTGYNDNGAEAILDAYLIDWSNIDIHTAGTYFVTVFLRIDAAEEDKFTLSPELEQIKLPICISDPDDFELFLARTISDQHIVYFLQNAETESTQIYAYFSPAACDYTALQNCSWTVCDENTALCMDEGFSILRSALPVGQYAYFYIQTADRTSQILEIYEDGNVTVSKEIRGDRDGSDTNFSSNPILTQPAPAIPSAEQTTVTAVVTNPRNNAPAPPDDIASEEDTHGQAYSIHAESEQTETTNQTKQHSTTTTTAATAATVAATISGAPQMEYSDSNMDILSGYRIHEMMKQSGGSATFSKNGITLSIPENAISFQDTDMVTVTLSAESESTYVVDILVNGERAVPQKSFTLWFPKNLFQSTESPVVKCDGVKQLMEYDKQSSAYYIRTTNLGTFQIVGDAATQEKQHALLWLIPAGIILVAGSAILLTVLVLRRKKAKRP